MSGPRGVRRGARLLAGALAAGALMALPVSRAVGARAAIAIPASPGGAPLAEPRADTALALEHVTVIDGTGAPPRSDRTVLVRDGRIAAEFATGSRPLPEGTREEDLSGRWLLPGLVDAHVHLTGAAPDMEGYRKALGWMLRGGVTTVRDMAGDDRILSHLARQANLGAMASPDIYYAALMAGPTFFAEDGRAQAASAGAVLGEAPWMRQVTAATDLPLAVAAARGTGATALKLYANLPTDLVAGLAAEAHRQGMLVWAHATVFPAGPMDVARAGTDALSHAAYLAWAAAPRVPQDYSVRARADYRHIAPDDPRVLAVLDTMKARGEILDATLWVFAHEAREAPDRVGDGIVDWESAVTRIARERGVLVDAGTDGMGSPEDTVPNLHREMAFLVERAGFTPLEAIEAATRVGAMTVGREATRGTVTPGKRADLLVLAADPTADIRATRRIVRVFKDGKAYEPERRP